MFKTKKHTYRSEKKEENKNNQKGFTLVELLVVLAILVVISGFVAPQVMNYLAKAKHQAAAIEIERLSGILDLYLLDNGRYPTTAEGLDALFEGPSGADGWNGPYIKKAEQLLDPWEAAYLYRSPGDHGRIDIWSLGADGREGGEDEEADVTSW